MTDEELREFAKELASELGVPGAYTAVTAAFFYVRAQTRLETARACAEECELKPNCGCGEKYASAIRARFGVEP